MFRDGLIYRGQRLVNWDSFLQTAVSDDEVFHETVAGHFWHFRYPVIDPRPGEPAHVTIATTRPETMLGDTAVAVHPDPAAALIGPRGNCKPAGRSGREETPAIKAQLEDIATRRRDAAAGLVKLADMAQAGRKLLLPLLDREIPLVADEWAKPELGSGCVKITPAHDVNDYEVGRRQSLPMINILNPDGTLNDNAGQYRGLKIMDAREQVVADLEALGLLEASRGSRNRAGPFRSLQNPDRALSGRSMVRADAGPGPIGDGRRLGRPSADFSVALCQGLSRLAGRKTRLARQPAALVGASNSGLASPQAARRPHEPGLAEKITAWQQGPLAAVGGAKATVAGWFASARKSDTDIVEALEQEGYSSAIPTCWIPGSARPCGRIPRWAGPTKRRS